jgi:hypothetical protein
MLIEKYLMKAHGDGDMEKSPVFKGTLDWLFKVICDGQRVEKEEIAGLTMTHVRMIMTPAFDFGKYELVHDFLNSESLMYTFPSNGEQQDEEAYLICECLADVIREEVCKWLDSEGALLGVNPGEVRSFATFVATGTLGSLFGMPIRDGVFERQIAQRCVTPELESVFKMLYGEEKALKIFPRSQMRGKWLEDSLGL